MPGTTKALNTVEPSQLSLRFNLLNTKVSALLLLGSGTLANDAKQIIAFIPLQKIFPVIVVTQALAVVVYGPGLHLHCLCELICSPSSAL